MDMHYRYRLPAL